MLSTGHEIRMNNSSKPNCIAGVVLVIDFFFLVGIPIYFHFVRVNLLLSDVDGRNLRGSYVCKPDFQLAQHS